VPLRSQRRLTRRAAATASFPIIRNGISTVSGIRRHSGHPRLIRYRTPSRTTPGQPAPIGWSSIADARSKTPEGIAALFAGDYKFNEDSRGSIRKLCITTDLSGIRSKLELYVQAGVIQQIDRANGLKGSRAARNTSTNMVVNHRHYSTIFNSRGSRDAAMCSEYTPPIRSTPWHFATTLAREPQPAGRPIRLTRCVIAAADRRAAPLTGTRPEHLLATGKQDGPCSLMTQP